MDEALRDEIMKGEVQPLAAYTSEETLINRGDYKKGLVGAAAIMSFRFKYALPWIPSTNRKDELQSGSLQVVRIIIRVNRIPCSPLLLEAMLRWRSLILCCLLWKMSFTLQKTTSVFSKIRCCSSIAA